MLTLPLKWHGGKHYLWRWIYGHIKRSGSTHRVDCFGGGGSCTLHNDPEGYSEVFNDLSLELANFWSVLKSEPCFHDFCRLVDATPFSELAFGSASVLPPTLVSEGPPDVGAAVDFFVRCRQSRQGLLKSFATSTKTRTRRGMQEQVSSWLTAVEGLPAVHARLKTIMIRNRHFRDLIPSEDSKNTVFYLDPPYLHSCRTAKDAYEHEMTVEDHQELLGIIENIKGKFVLSGYPSEMYENRAIERGWNLDIQPIDNKSSSDDVKEIKYECLWMNF